MTGNDALGLWWLHEGGYIDDQIERTRCVWVFDNFHQHYEGRKTMWGWVFTPFMKLDKQWGGKDEVSPLKLSDDTESLAQAPSTFSKNTRGRNKTSPRDIEFYYCNKKRHLGRGCHACKRNKSRELSHNIPKDKESPMLFSVGDRKQKKSST